MGAEENPQLYTEPTIALRVWRVRRSYGNWRLESPSKHAGLHGVWEPFREFIACCAKCKTPEGLYDCECGVYAWDLTSKEGLLAMIASSITNEYVAGEVKLWGNVQLGDNAHRASKAYPNCLLVFNDYSSPEKVAQVQTVALQYGIPVKYMDVDPEDLKKIKHFKKMR